MRRPLVWAWAGAAAALALALALFDPRIFTGGDNAVYYALAEALATGRGYVDPIAPGHPPHAVYPPGYPAFLVPFYWLFSGSIVGLKVASLVAGAVALWGVWRVAARDPAVPAWAAAAAVGLVGLYRVFLDYTHWVLSDMAYLAVTLLAVAAFLEAERGESPAGESGEDPPPDRWTGAWTAGLALALASFSVRTAGLTLLLAALLHAVVHRRWARAGSALGFTAAAVAPWYLWTSAHAPATGSYLEQLLASNRMDPLSPPISLGELAVRSWDNLVHYTAAELPRLFWPGETVPSLLLVAALFLGGPLLIWGVLRAWRTRGVEVWDLHVVGTIGLLAVWPWTGDRFFLTIAPLLWVYLLIGMDAASRLWARSAVPATALAGALAAFLALGAAARVPGQWEVTRAHVGGDEWAGYDPFWVDYFEASAWIGETAPDAVIVARKPSLAWYWSGRPAFVHPFRVQPRETWALLRERGATHVLYDNLGAADLYLRPSLDLHPEAIELVHSAPARNVFVLRIAPPATGPDPETPPAEPAAGPAPETTPPAGAP